MDNSSIQINRVTRKTKIIAVVTAFFFLAQTVCSAAPELPQTQALPREFALPPLNIEIPRELGEIRSAHQASESSGVIIHIQDAHGNYEAQKNIEKIVRHLHDRYKVRFVFLEGADAPVDPSEFHFFADNGLNVEMADVLMKHGEFSGSEMFLLKNSRPGKTGSAVEGYGIEETALYRQDIELFRKVLAGREESSLFIDQLHAGLGLLESRFFSNDIRDFLKEWRGYQNRGSLLTFINLLYKEALERLSLDLKSPASQMEYPALLRVLKLKDMEASLDPKPVREEMKALLAFLEGKIDGKLLGSLASLGIDAPRDARVNPRFVIEKIDEQARGLGLDFTHYPHLSGYLAYLAFQQEIDSETLFKEIDAVTRKIFDTLIRTPEQKELLQLIRDCVLLEKLYKLELSRQEYRDIRSREAEFDPPSLSGRLAKFSVQEANLDVPQPMRERFADSLEFYRLAEAREQAFIRKTLDTMREKQAEKVVLVTGGFHSEGVEELVKQSGISYVSIAPRILEMAGDAAEKSLKEGQEMYLNAMLGETRIEESQIALILHLLGIRNQQGLGVLGAQRLQANRSAAVVVLVRGGMTRPDARNVAAAVVDGGQRNVRVPVRAASLGVRFNLDLATEEIIKRFVNDAALNKFPTLKSLAEAEGLPTAGTLSRRLRGENLDRMKEMINARAELGPELQGRINAAIDLRIEKLARFAERRAARAALLEEPVILPFTPLEAPQTPGDQLPQAEAQVMSPAELLTPVFRTETVPDPRPQPVWQGWSLDGLVAAATNLWKRARGIVDTVDVTVVEFGNNVATQTVLEANGERMFRLGQGEDARLISRGQLRTLMAEAGYLWPFPDDQWTASPAANFGPGYAAAIPLAASLTDQLAGLLNEAAARSGRPVSVDYDGTGWQINESPVQPDRYELIATDGSGARRYVPTNELIRILKDQSLARGTEIIYSGERWRVEPQAGRLYKITSLDNPGRVDYINRATLERYQALTGILTPRKLTLQIGNEQVTVERISFTDSGFIYHLLNGKDTGLYTRDQLEAWLGKNGISEWPFRDVVPVPSVRANASLGEDTGTVNINVRPVVAALAVIPMLFALWTMSIAADLNLARTPVTSDLIAQKTMSEIFEAGAGAVVERSGNLAGPSVSVLLPPQEANAGTTAGIVITRGPSQGASLGINPIQYADVLRVIMENPERLAGLQAGEADILRAAYERYQQQLDIYKDRPDTLLRAAYETLGFFKDLLPEANAILRREAERYARLTPDVGRTKAAVHQDNIGNFLNQFDDAQMIVTYRVQPGQPVVRTEMTVAQVRGVYSPATDNLVTDAGGLLYFITGEYGLGETAVHGARAYADAADDYTFRYLPNTTTIFDLTRYRAASLGTMGRRDFLGLGAKGLLAAALLGLSSEITPAAAQNVPLREPEHRWTIRARVDFRFPVPDDKAVKITEIKAITDNAKAILGEAAEKIKPEDLYYEALARQIFRHAHEQYRLGQDVITSKAFEIGDAAFLVGEQRKLAEAGKEVMTTRQLHERLKLINIVRKVADDIMKQGDFDFDLNSPLDSGLIGRFVDLIETRAVDRPLPGNSKEARASQVSLRNRMVKHFENQRKAHKLEKGFPLAVTEFQIRTDQQVLNQQQKLGRVGENFVYRLARKYKLETTAKWTAAYELGDAAYWENEAQKPAFDVANLEKEFLIMNRIRAYAERAGRDGQILKALTKDDISKLIGRLKNLPLKDLVAELRKEFKLPPAPAAGSMGEAERLEDLKDTIGMDLGRVKGGVLQGFVETRNSLNTAEALLDYVRALLGTIGTMRANALLGIAADDLKGRGQVENRFGRALTNLGRTAEILARMVEENAARYRLEEIPAIGNVRNPVRTLAQLNALLRAARIYDPEAEIAVTLARGVTVGGRRLTQPGFAIETVARFRQLFAGQPRSPLAFAALFGGAIVLGLLAGVLIALAQPAKPAKKKEAPAPPAKKEEPKKEAPRIQYSGNVLSQIRWDVYTADSTPLATARENPAVALKDITTNGEAWRMGRMQIVNVKNLPFLRIRYTAGEASEIKIELRNGQEGAEGQILEGEKVTVPLPAAKAGEVWVDLSKIVKEVPDGGKAILIGISDPKGDAVLNDIRFTSARGPIAGEKPAGKSLGELPRRDFLRIGAAAMALLGLDGLEAVAQLPTREPENRWKIRSPDFKFPIPDVKTAKVHELQVIKDNTARILNKKPAELKPEDYYAALANRILLHAVRQYRLDQDSIASELFTEGDAQAIANQQKDFADKGEVDKIMTAAQLRARLADMNTIRRVAEEVAEEGRFDFDLNKPLAIGDITYFAERLEEGRRPKPDADKAPLKDTKALKEALVKHFEEQKKAVVVPANFKLSPARYELIPDAQVKRIQQDLGLTQASFVYRLAIKFRLAEVSMTTPAYRVGDATYWEERAYRRGFDVSDMKKEFLIRNRIRAYAQLAGKLQTADDISKLMGKFKALPMKELIPAIRKEFGLVPKVDAKSLGTRVAAPALPTVPVTPAAVIPVPALRLDDLARLLAEENIGDAGIPGALQEALDHSARTGRANPLSVIRTAEGVMLKIYQQDDLTLVSFYRARVGSFSASAAPQAAESIDYFNSGHLTPLIREEIGAGEVEQGRPVVVYVDQILAGLRDANPVEQAREADRLARKFADRLNPGDLFIGIWSAQLNKNKKPPIIAKLHQLAAGQVRDIQQELVSNQTLNAILKPFNTAAVSVSDLNETQDLEFSFNGVKIKFNVAELIKHGVDPVEAVGLVKQYADNPSALRRMNIEQKGAYWEVGLGFVGFISQFYDRMKAQQRIAVAA